MPKDRLQIRPNLSVDIVYVGRKFHAQLQYLNSVRTGRTPSEAVTQQYRGMEKWHAGALARELSPIPANSAILKPPSSRTDADAYLSAVLAANANLIDISERMTRKGKIKAATANSLGAVIKELNYAPKGDEATFNDLYILDETVGTGRTVAAILYHLCNAGLREDCRVVVATALWVDP